jgi:antitoxin ParD1/3/4
MLGRAMPGSEAMVNCGVLDSQLGKRYFDSMVEIIVSLPKPLKDWAEAQATTCKYASTGDFVRDLLSHEQDQRGKLELLQTEIDRGLSASETGATIETIIAESRA